MCLSTMALVVAWLVPLAASQFVPPAAILQAGYPAGFRAFIPDFPGCEMFGFHAKVNSPFIGEEPGTFSQEILRPYRGFWVFQDLSAILTPGDIIHYWTLIVKDGIEYTKRNQTWKVPDPDESVDLLSPVTLKPSPEKMVDAEPTTQPENETPPTETSSTNEDTTPSSDSEPSQTSTPSPAPTTESTTPKTTPTTESTTPKPTPTTKMTPATKPTTTTTKKPPATTEKPKPTKPKKSTPAPPNPLMKEDVEELTTPAFPFDKPISSEFPEESPSLFPFPSLFPRPFKPMMPPTGPGFEICSNPWNFEEQPGESRTQRLERQVAKLQCQLALFQRGYTQLGNNVENELTDLKKLIYGMVARMARLESVIRSSPFG